MDRVLLRTLFLFATTLLVLWAFIKILSPFLVPIAWALCIAAISHAAYLALAGRWRKPRLAALVMVIVTALLIIGPALVVLAVAVEEMTALARTGATGWVNDVRGALPGFYRWLSGALENFDTDVETAFGNLADAAPEFLLRPVAAGAWTMLGSLLTALLGLVIMLASQYFVYTEGARLRAITRDLSPLSVEDTDRILETLRSTTVAAVLGGLVVAMLQGALGGVGFAIVGIRAPVLWGLVMAFFSLLPIGGAAFIWGPVVIYFFAVGSLGRAWFLLIWGLVMVGSLDNLVRPWLLRRAGASVHPMLLFFAILSGIGLFGMSGIVFGPILIALLMTVAQIYREHVAPLVSGRENVAEPDADDAPEPRGVSP